MKEWQGLLYLNTGLINFCTHQKENLQKLM